MPGGAVLAKAPNLSTMPCSSGCTMNAPDKSHTASAGKSCHKRAAVTGTVFQETLQPFPANPQNTFNGRQRRVSEKTASAKTVGIIPSHAATERG
jgi:hypothetical protein